MAVLRERTGRMTVFAAGGHARTMDFREGDVGYVERTRPHYVKTWGHGFGLSRGLSDAELPGHLARAVAGARSFAAG